MKQNENYYDYSAQDAAEHLLFALEHFLDREENPYKFTLPKKHLQALKNEFDFPDAHKIFKIITGTTLVTSKIIMRYRTSQGLRYKINKEFSQAAHRAQRAQRRTQSRNVAISTITPSKTNTKPSLKPPLVQLMEEKRENPLDYTSSDDDSDVELSNNEPKDDTTKLQSTPPEESPEDIANRTESSKQISDRDEEYDDCTLKSDVTKQADELEKSLDAAVAQLKADANIDSNEDILQDKLSQVIKTLVQDELRQCRQEYDTKQALLDKSIAELEKTKSDLFIVLQTSKEAHADLIAKNDRLSKKIQYFTRNVTEFEERLIALSTTESTLTASILSKTNAQIKRVCDEHFPKNTIPLDNNKQMDDLKRTQDTILRKLTRLKTGTKTLFQRTDDDYEMISARASKVETDMHNMQYNVTSSNLASTQVLPRHPLSDSDDDSITQPMSSKSADPRQTATPHQRQFNGVYPTHFRQSLPMPNMDYLRKNVNITCSHQDQILEFYIKFWLAVQKGGIYIIPIEDITKSAGIA